MVDHVGCSNTNPSTDPTSMGVGHAGRLGRRRFLASVVAAGVGIAALDSETWASGQAETPAGMNLVPNPGFEEVLRDKPTQWHPFSPASEQHIRSAQDHVGSGSRSVRLEDPSSSDGVGLRSSLIPVSPGLMYNASVFVYAADGVASLYLEFWDGGNRRTSFEFRVSSTVKSWQRIDVGAVAPDDAVHATVLLYLAATNTGLSYFDDAALVEDSAPVPTVLGPASLTAAVRGATLRGNSMFISSRFNTPDQRLRLAEFDVRTGEPRAVDDLAVPSAGGHKLASDDRYIYVGPAGSPHVWRFDPGSKELEAWSAAGTSTTWYYEMVVDGDYLYIGTYPDCTVKRIRRSDATIQTYGRISESKYATAIAVDEDYVYAGSAAPGTLLVWPKDGGTPTDLTEHLSDSPVGILDLAVKDKVIYAASGRQLISFRVDGSERVSREIPAEDRYLDQVTVGADGKVYAVARLTTNVYEVTATGLSKVGQPLGDAENQLLAATSDGSLAGVTGLGHIWRMAPGEAADVWQTATRGFGYPEVVQSMLLDSERRVWVGGHYAMTVHDLDEGTSTRFDINGEPKSLAEGARGIIYAGLYPSTQVVAIEPRSHDVTVLGLLGNEQLRARAMHADIARNRLLVASSPATTKHTGALTFIDLASSEFDVHREYLPEQSVMDIAVSGRTVYLVGDTYGEGTPGPIRPAAQVAAVDLVTRELLWREEIKPDWASYESVHVVGNLLYAMGRRPRGAWYAYDLTSRRIVIEGDLGGYGQFGGTDKGLFTWVHWSNDICELPTASGEPTRTIYDNVPNGWYNDPLFNLKPSGRATWGMHGTDLALFPLPRAAWQ